GGAHPEHAAVSGRACLVRRDRRPGRGARLVERRPHGAQQADRPSAPCLPGDGRRVSRPRECGAREDCPHEGQVMSQATLPSVSEPVAPESEGPAGAFLRKLAPQAPLLLVAFAVLFGAWLLRAELRVAAFPNDETVHSAMARLA